MYKKSTHLDGIIVQWINSFDAETDANQDEDRTIAPFHATGAVPPRRVHDRARGCVDIGFVECAIRGDSDPETSVREVIYKGPEGEMSILQRVFRDEART